ncbi:Reelin domain-containing protein 1 [Holothuria leucospilota]|uniref:Reelin domain-containing protein 1 n=1 Tax=Holothuria leucospilota TaxID=206669 RepID=A0A9Q1BX15_HOLLE|nr:Reelin domain-containing protein 1 [Holothuria leucospilota]
MTSSMEKCFLLPCLLLLATSSIVQSQFDTGATTNECVSLQPVGFTNSAGITPFIVATSPNSYSPGGQPVQVFIVSSPSIDVRGLVIQARRTNGDTSPVGSFSLPIPNNLYRFLTCGTSTTGTVTNTGASTKTTPITLSWTPPAVGVGNVNFFVSLAQTNGSFWSRIGSRNLLTGPPPPPVPLPLSISPCPTPTVQGFQARWPTLDCMRGTAVLGNSATCNPPSDSTFLPGDTDVTCTCQDQGETASCTFIVTVVADVCVPNPCQNGGTCIEVPQLQDGFICQCLPGFDLPFCTGGGPGDSCAGNPCSGNECRESPNSLAGYTCHSVTGTPCPQA